MKVIKELKKINAGGSLVIYNPSLRRWELSYKSWSWEDISPGYIQESKRNYKLSKERDLNKNPNL